MNSLTDELITGTTGELLVQLRLFQYDVQAAPPLKDSGNDLIAVRGEDFMAVQVKTTGQENGGWSLPSKRGYHILALVRLEGEGDELYLDTSDVYLLERDTVESDGFSPSVDLSDYEISRPLVDDLFPSNAREATSAAEA
jgi:hypothetical protein